MKVYTVGGCDILGFQQEVVDRYDYKHENNHERKCDFSSAGRDVRVRHISAMAWYMGENSDCKLLQSFIFLSANFQIKALNCVIFVAIQKRRSKIVTCPRFA